MPKGLPREIIKKYGVTKKAWTIFRGKRKPKTYKSPKQYVSKVRHMAKRRRRRSGGMTIPLAPIVGLAAGMIEPATLATQGNVTAAFQTLCRNYTGYDPITMKWDHTLALRGLAPLAVGLLVHKYVGGKPLNFNAVLARAKVPIIRL